MSRFASPNKIRSDDWGVNPTPPKQFGTPGHKYAKPTAQQRLPGFSFSAPPKVRNSSDDASKAANSSTKLKSNSQSPSNEGTSGMLGSVPAPEWPAKILEQKFERSADHHLNTTESNDDTMTMSSISNSRVSLQRRYHLNKRAVLMSANVL